jgi:integrase
MTDLQFAVLFRLVYIPAQNSAEFAGYLAVGVTATAEIVAAFIGAEADRGIKASTIGRRVAAIWYAHKLAGLPAPTEIEAVRAVIRGIRRTIGTARTAKVPATSDRLLAMVAAQKRDSGKTKMTRIPPTPYAALRQYEDDDRVPNSGMSIAAVRDRALLLLGFAGAFRRSELVALDVADIEETSEGLRVSIRGGKTDQERTGTTIAIVRGSVACPVCGVHHRGGDFPARK